MGKTETNLKQEGKKEPVLDVLRSRRQVRGFCVLLSDRNIYQRMDPEPIRAVTDGSKSRLPEA